MSSIYYRVDHKKKMVHFDNASLAKIKSVLFYELSSKNESTIYEQILKIFNSLMKDIQYKPKDKLYLIYALTEEYKKINNIQLENYDKISLNVCKKIAKTDFKMSLNFNWENINDICTLISLGFTKLFSMPKKKIKTYDLFLKEIQIYKSLFIDLLQIYKSYNYSLPAIVPEIPRNTMPNEILLLMEIFQKIKHINLSLKDYNKESIIPYLIVLLNYDWLFPFVFEIDLDLTHEELAEEIMKLYYLKEKSIYIKNKNNKYDSDELDDEEKEDKELNQLENINLIIKDINFYNNKNINWKLVEKEKIFNKRKNFNINNNSNNANKLENNIPVIVDKYEESYMNIIKKYRMVFDIILCYYYLIKEVKYLKTFTINMPNGFIKENIDALKLKILPEIDVSKINIFEYLTIISSLHSFNISFNSLEQKTFENILYIIQNNSNLKELKMDFFPGDYKKLTPQNLIKLAEESDICQKILTDSKHDNAFLTITYDNEKMIKQKLLEKFEVNFEKLFLLLQTKKRLEKIELIINLPLILYDNEGYHWTILKFLLNMLILMQKEVFNLKEFKIILPFFNMDNRKYPIIGDFLEKINLNEKHKYLKNFEIQANFFKLNNIINLIPYNLLSLNLGEFDLDIFRTFVDFYHSEGYLEKSQLKSISIALNKTVVKYHNCKAYLTDFIGGKNPKNLIEVSLKCYFRIKRKDLHELLKKGNGNKVEKYNITMKIDNPKKYQKIVNHKDFYYFNDEVKNEINKYITVLKKTNLLENNNKNLTKRIIKCLIPSNGKTIVISNISSRNNI